MDGDQRQHHTGDDSERSVDREQSNNVPDMQRVLDLDLDFFIYGVASAPFDGPRLDPEEYPPRGLEDVMAFLQERCHLVEPLPGRAVEHHGEVFGLWRDGLLVYRAVSSL